MIRIGVQVVVNNKYEVTKDFLDNFYEHFSNDERVTLLVVDNNSSDGTYERIEKEYKFAKLVRLNDNYGTTTGRNVGIVLLIEEECDYIYLSDNDIEFRDEHFFEKMLSFHDDNPNVKGSCPVVRWYDGEDIQTLGTREKFKNWYSNLSEIGENIYINTLPGCSQFIKSSAFLEYGVFDNDLSPISIEDLEWGVRVSKKGGKLAYNRNTEVYHKQKKVSSNSPEKMRFVLMGRGVFLRKYFSPQALFRELKNFVYCIPNYGFAFTIKSYYEGFKKSLSADNYNYIKFRIDLSKYIVNKNF